MRGHKGHRYLADPLFARYPEALSHALSELTPYVREGGAFAAIDSRGAVHGLLCMRRRKWDTTHFGYPVATIDHLYVQKGPYAAVAARELVEHFDRWAKEHAIRFASAKMPADPAITKALGDHGFYHVETGYHLTKELPDPALAGSGDPRVRRARKSDLKPILDIAYRAPWPGRFHEDPHIDKEHGRMFRVAWIQNGTKKPNHVLTVIEHRGRPAGFVLWTYASMKLGERGRRVADWELSAVDTRYAGRGLGGVLYHGTLLEMQRRGVRLVTEGVAAHNAAALNLKARLGFRFNYSFVAYHKFYS